MAIWEAFYAIREKMFDSILHGPGAILLHSRPYRFKIFFSHGESISNPNMLCLEYSRSYNFKIFFNHGEGKIIPNKPF